MRKRKGGIGGTLSGLLKTRIEGCLHQFPDVDDLVRHLCSRYPDYGRLGERRLTTSVQQALNFLKSPRKSRNISDEADEAEEEPSSGPANKRFKKADSREAKLLQMESQHRKKNFKFEDDDDEDEDTSYSSTSDDAIFDEKFEPDVDVTKSLLRQSYAKDIGIKAEKNVEMEDGGGKEEKKLVEMGKGGNQVKEGDNSVKRGGEMKDKEEFKGIKFKDLGGMTEILDDLRMDVLVPLYSPELPKWLGIKPTSGILLHGPPGCGKTKLAHAIANEAAVPFYKISATEVVSGVSGASEENIRELFSKAQRTAPSIVFIDEIDAIASKRENLQREMERRIVTQLLTCMDESYLLVQSADVDTKSGLSGNRSGYVLVIGATNRPDVVDAALRRPGRFDREIMIGIPDENARAQILSVLTRNLRLEGSFDFLKIARSTAGFVGADLTALTSKAGNLAMKRIVYERKSKLCAEPVDTEQTEEWWKQSWSPEDMEKLNITMSDFEEAAKLVQPSLRREGFSAIPNVKWEDIGGLDSLRKEFKHSIVRRISHPEDDEEFGVELEQGFLLYGPPGCGKTLIAKAVANEAGANFIHIKGPEILNKYVGESELAVRTIFSRARMCSPCILFLDEIDALTTKRGSEGGRVVDSLLNQLLIELDGADNRKGVFVIGATNRPEVIDPALLRPRRLGKLVYVPLPGPDERGSILKALARAKPIDADADLDAIARREVCENLSGSDLYKLINEAADAAKVEKRERLLVSSEDIPSTIKMKHFEQALTEISPSVSEKEKRRYEVICKNFRRL